MTTIGKADIVTHLTETIGLSRREANDIVKHFFAAITEDLSKGSKVKISGFGNFNVIMKKARPGRNPKTGVPVMVSARQVVTFRAGQKLKLLLQNHHEN